MTTLTNQTTSTPSVSNGAVSGVSQTNNTIPFSQSVELGNTASSTAFAISTGPLWYAAKYTLLQETLITDVIFTVSWNSVQDNAVSVIYSDNNGVPGSILHVSEEHLLNYDDTLDVATRFVFNNIILQPGTYWFASNTKQSAIYEYVDDASYTGSTAVNINTTYSASGINVPSYTTPARYPLFRINGYVRTSQVDTQADATVTYGETEGTGNGPLFGANRLWGVSLGEFPGGKLIHGAVYVSFSGISTGSMTMGVYINGELYTHSTRTFSGYRSQYDWFFFLFGDESLPPGVLSLAFISDITLNLSTSATQILRKDTSYTYTNGLPQLLSFSTTSRQPCMYIETRQANLTSLLTKPSTWAQITGSWATNTGTWESYTDIVQLTNT